MNLKRGSALIISGPAGSGKTRKALEIAVSHEGKYIHTTWQQVNTPSKMASVLHRAPEVVIVDEVVTDEEFFAAAKILACEDLIEVRPKHGFAYMAKNPLWIFTTCLPVELPEGTRRFTVITLNGDKS